MTLQVLQTPSLLIQYLDCCTDAGATFSGAPEGKQELARGQPGIFWGVFGWQPMLGTSRELARGCELPKALQLWKLLPAGCQSIQQADHRWLQPLSANAPRGKKSPV